LSMKATTPSESRLTAPGGVASLFEATGRAPGAATKRI